MAENKRFTVLVRKGEAVVPIPDRSKDRSKDRCICNWSECTQWRRYFEKEDPTGLRSGCCFTLQVNGLGKYFDEQSQREYASSILSSLDVTDAEFPVRKQQKLLVARHHYDPRQLVLFKQYRQARNMPLTREAMRTYTHGLVELNVMDGNNKEERFFHIPNFEKTAVQRRVEGSAVMSRSERAQQLDQRRIEYEVREQVDAEKTAFENQLFVDFCGQRRAMAELRKELAEAFETSKALSVQLDKEKGVRRNAERKLEYWKEKADPHKYLRQKRRRKNKNSKSRTTTTTRNTEVISTFIHASDPLEPHALNLGNNT
mmetsp:Transcript_15660/g.28475  ORF Transcript_15660/g.28475 Transcript_15660/m.28475 type:complete len:315 (-) Transcript_15660:120-1064(-)